uniref:Uncharacterized protein n=1 Tax=Panagrolaimus sp. ES5 TaxID=591445 RepID=A0AC34FZ95_9BILA
MNPSHSLSQTLLNILNTSYSPEADENTDVAGGSNTAAESSDEEYYVCLKCESLGIAEQDHCINNAQNSCSEKENRGIVKREPRPCEPQQSESIESNETTDTEGNIVDNVILRVDDIPPDIKLEPPKESSSNINDELVISNQSEHSQIEVETPNNNEAGIIKEMEAEISDVIASEDIIPSATLNDTQKIEILDLTQPSTQSIGVQTEEVFSTTGETAVTNTLENIDTPASVAVIEEAYVDVELSNITEVVDAPVTVIKETKVAVELSNITEVVDAPVSVVINHKDYINVETTVTCKPEVAEILIPVPVISEAFMKSHTNVENETRNLNDNPQLFETPVFRRFNQSRAVSEGSHNTSTTASPLDASTTSSTSTAIPQTFTTPKIESKALFSLFQRPSENMYGDLTALLKSAGVEITGEEDPEFLNEIKDVKIKIETPRSIKQELGLRKRRRLSPTPKKPKKGSVNTVKVRKTGETKAFVEWDSDCYVESD